jgi:hypothetical protein
MNDIESILRELARRPHVGIIGKDPQSRMFRLDWKDNHRRHQSRVFSELEQAVSSARNLELNGIIVGFKVLGRAKPHSWVPHSRETELGRF